MGAGRWTWVAAGAAVVVAAVPALPFARSGARVRSGYALIRTAESAGFLDGAVGRAALVALAVLPLLAAGAFAAASLRRRVAVATLALMAGLIVTAAGAAVVLAPLHAEPGAALAIVAGGACMAAALVAAVADRRAG